MKNWLLVGLAGAVVIIGVFVTRNLKLDEVHAKTRDPIRVLILPHHDLAREILTEASERLRGQNTNLIIVLSPNHFKPRGPMFTTTPKLKGYKINEGLVKALSQSQMSTVTDEVLLDHEHGLLTPMKYLSMVLPEAQFVPIAVSPYYSPAKIDELGKWILNNSNDKTMVVASVDFAHELQQFEGMQHNEISIAAIEQFDYGRIRGFTDKYMDSPAAITIAMKVAERLKLIRFETWYSTHGSVFLKDPSAQSTSYVIGAFR